ncbi:hypothetical protein GCM10010168_78500 [Actinoplanes ianthinogenes]|uniref:Uncharacterized protein n=1 Tax=Actinoplanes ianthinogenes TaxID=122358 RepID=A0ABN6C511_9ACTN|nr:fatty acid--CoA ligase family protein [Actinoplanes ianthinogenes]BCJ39694.1 hypothetical protein Aiant_03510 [Actinoplanes ianthinogenes]GGR48074.1 hypothetical protein GCM10010168_78500 [Actinoplanes ianthinogenes]
MVTGNLFLDGVPVEAATLRRTLDEVVRHCGRLGAGPGRAIMTACRTGLGALAAVVAARRLGAAVAFSPPALQLELCARLATYSAAEIVEGRDGMPEVLPVAGPGRATLPAEAAAVFPTSGSTGRPRLVLLSHAALEYQTRETAARLGIGDADTMLVPLPLAHAYGLTIALMWLSGGGDLLVETSFTVGGLTRRLLTRDVTTLDGVPSMYSLLLGAASREPAVAERLRRVRVRGIGGDVLHPALAARFAALGADLHDGYGLTEAGPNVAVSAPGLTRPGTVGLPLHGTEVRRAASGELVIRTPSRMLGYLGDPEATAAALTATGWLRSGDIGEVDPDGHVRVLGRLKEALIVDGETHAPTSIEDVLRTMSGVVEACVLGVRSAEDTSGRGDRVVAFVEMAEPVAVADLRTLCRRHLPPRLRPRDIHIDVPLPRTGTGKVDRAALRRWVAQEAAARKEMTHHG